MQQCCEMRVVSQFVVVSFLYRCSSSPFQRCMSVRLLDIIFVKYCTFNPKLYLTLHRKLHLNTILGPNYCPTFKKLHFKCTFKPFTRASPAYNPILTRTVINVKGSRSHFPPFPHQQQHFISMQQHVSLLLSSNNRCT